MTKPHSFHPTILRAYDIRGVYQENLFEKDAYYIGLSFGTIVKKSQGKKVVLGYDGRLSSPSLAKEVEAGLLSSGVDVINIGLGPTPMLYFAAHHLKCDAGIMVTGSHNPKNYNGFKLTLNNKSFYGDDIQKLGQLSESGLFSSGTGHSYQSNVENAYIQRLLQEDLKNQERPLNIVWDAGNGATGNIVKALIEKLPGQHIVINSHIDGTFPNHHPDPTIPENLEQLKTLVLEKSFDLGIGFDGDGDRIGLITKAGKFVPGDHLLLILALNLLHEIPKSKIVADVKMSQSFYDTVRQKGGKPIMWCSGHALVRTKMFLEKAPLAGEMSGHIFFGDRYYGFDDAIYAALRVIRTLNMEGQTFDDLMLNIPATYSTPEIRFQCPEDKKFTVVEKIKKLLLENKYKGHIFDLDGVRFTSTNGWWLLRASNTQDVLVVRCEANTKENLVKLIDEVSLILKTIGISPPPELNESIKN